MARWSQCFRGQDGQDQGRYMHGPMIGALNAIPTQGM